MHVFHSARAQRSLAAAVFFTAILAALVPVSSVAGEPKKEQPAEAKQDEKLAELISPIRESHNIPAAFAAIIEGDKLLAVAAVGVRSAESKEQVTVNDKVHIGSDTKAMTATMIAMLVEKKQLRWDSTIGGIFPSLKKQIHADYLNVTLKQLLSHEAGVVPNIDWWAAPRNQTPRQHRNALLPTILKDAPTDKPGTKFVYSNASFVVAAAMAEKAANDSWENLMNTTLFKPLGMKSAGFGSPGLYGKCDQPWGHMFAKDKLEPTQNDNAPVLGPAATVHVSMSDWAKFATLHLLGARGKAKLLKPESFTALHTPTEGFKYSGGWGVGEDGRLSHDGSNTYWFTRVRLFTKHNFGILVAVNMGGDEANRAADEIEKAATDYYLANFQKK